MITNKVESLAFAFGNQLHYSGLANGIALELTGSEVPGLGRYVYKEFWLGLAPHMPESELPRGTSLEELRPFNIIRACICCFHLHILAAWSRKHISLGLARNT